MNSGLSHGRFVEILLVEDNENDVILTREGFRQAKLAVRLHHVGDGQECMAFLRKSNQHTDAPTPDLILLDINMPVMNGREVMAELSADPDLRHLPVVILTTSKEEQDVLYMYKLRCSSFITKPIDFQRFLEVIRCFGDYWLSVVVLPEETLA